MIDARASLSARLYSQFNIATIIIIINTTAMTSAKT